MVVVVEVLLYVRRNRRLIRDGSPGRPPQLSHSSWARTNVPLVEDQHHFALRPQKRGCLLGTGTGGGGGGEGRKTEGSTADTARKRPEKPWTAARTMEVLRRCPLAIAQRLVHRAIAVSTAVLGRVTRTMSVALLLRNNSKRKKSNFRSPAPPPYS